MGALAELTGCARTTIQAGMKDLAGGANDGPLPTGRSRRGGAGRKKLSVSDPGLVAALDAQIDARPRRRARRQGRQASSRSVAQLLEDGLGFSLKPNRKTVEGKQHPDRDAQFRYINERVRRFSRRGAPVVSVDSKKKELVGNYDDEGQTWRRKNDPEKVKSLDFIDKQLGKTIPYGILDMSRNRGWVSVGIDHDTAAFGAQLVGRREKGFLPQGAPAAHLRRRGETIHPQR